MDDAEELRSFYTTEGVDPGRSPTETGVLARLVGDVVAHMTWEISGNSAWVTHVYVSGKLRRKRVGRGLVEDAVGIARAKGLQRIVVSGSCETREFFVCTGFAEVGNELIREVC